MWSGRLGGLHPSYQSLYLAVCVLLALLGGGGGRVEDVHSCPIL